MAYNREPERGYRNYAYEDDRRIEYVEKPRYYDDWRYKDYPGSHPIYLPPRSDDREYYDNSRPAILPGHSYIQEPERQRPRSNSFSNFERPYNREPERGYRNYAYEDDRRIEYVEKPRYYDDRYVERERYTTSRPAQYEERVILSPSTLGRDQYVRRTGYEERHMNEQPYGLANKKFNGDWLDRHYFKSDFDYVNKNAVVNGRDPFLWRPIKTWNTAFDK